MRASDRIVRTAGRRLQLAHNILLPIHLVCCYPLPGVVPAQSSTDLQVVLCNGYNQKFASLHISQLQNEMWNHIKYIQASLQHRIDRSVQRHSCMRHANLSVRNLQNCSIDGVMIPTSCCDGDVIERVRTSASGCAGYGIVVRLVVLV